MAASPGPLLRRDRLSSRAAGRWALGALGLLYTGFVFLPIALRLAGGHAFGWDIGEYAATGASTLFQPDAPFRYPFPLLPALYALGLLGHPSSVLLYYVADLASGGLMVALFLAAGYLGYGLERSLAGAAAAGTVVGTFSLILGEVGWGGQAQLASFALGTAALGVLVGERTVAARRGAGWIAGGLLAAATAAETYSAAFFGIAAVLWLLVEHRATLFRRAAALRYLPVVGLPLAVLGVVLATGGFRASSVVASPVLPYVLRWGGWQRAFPDLGFGNPVNAIGYPLLVATFVAFALAVPRRPGRGLVLVATTAGAGAAQILLVTPAVYWDRAEYFVVFPLAAAAAVLVPELRQLVPRRWVVPVGRDRPVPPRIAGGRRWLVGGCAAIAVAVLLGQTGVAVELYPPALGYYAANASAFGDLGWLRAEPGSALLVAPAGELFDLAYATGRPMVPFAQPLWYDTEEERAAAIAANLLVAGPSWIDLGPVSVVDTPAPLNTSSPAVFVHAAPYELKLFEVFEAAGTVTPAVATPPPLHADLSRPEHASPSAWPSFVDADAIPGYSVTKTTAVGGGGVAVNLTFAATTSASPSAHVCLASPAASIQRVTADAAGLRVAQRFANGGSLSVHLATTVGFTASPTAGASSPVVTSTSRGPALCWNLAPTASGVGTTFSLSVALSEPGWGKAVPQPVSETSVLPAFDVQWVVLDIRTEGGAIPRFLVDPTCALVWSDGTFEVYHVG